MNTAIIACLLFFGFFTKSPGESFFEANQQAELPNPINFPLFKLEFTIYKIDHKGFRLTEKLDFEFAAKTRWINTIFSRDYEIYAGEFSLDVVDTFPFKKVPCVLSFKDEEIKEFSKESLILLLGPSHRVDGSRLYWAFYSIRNDKTIFQWVVFDLKSDGDRRVPIVYVGESEIKTTAVQNSKGSK